jgi:hypothetical protein
LSRPGFKRNVGPGRSAMWSTTAAEAWRQDANEADALDKCWLAVGEAGGVGALASCHEHLYKL